MSVSWSRDGWVVKLTDLGTELNIRHEYEVSGWPLGWVVDCRVKHHEFSCCVSLVGLQEVNATDWAV